MHRFCQAAQASLLLLCGAAVRCLAYAFVRPTARPPDSRSPAQELAEHWLTATLDSLTLTPSPLTATSRTALDISAGSSQLSLSVESPTIRWAPSLVMPHPSFRGVASSRASSKSRTA